MDFDYKSLYDKAYRFFYKYEKLPRVRVPVCLQMEATECGAASLSMILSYYGLWIPLEKLRQMCGVSRNGSKASNILKVARKLNCEAQGYRVLASKIPEMDFPLIIHWEFNHFLVLEGIKGDTVYLNDPAVGRRTVKLAEFNTSYTGVAISIKPGPDFKPAGHRYSVVKAIRSKVLEDKWAAIFVLLVGLGTTVCQLASPVFSQIFLDDIITGKHPDWMNTLLIAMTVAFILSGVLSFLQSWCLTRWQEKVTLADSSKFFMHALKLPIEFFQQRYAAEIASRAAFTQEIAAVISGPAASCVLNFVMAVFFLFLLWEYSPSLTIIGLSFNLIDLWIFFYLRRRMTDMAMRLQQETGKAYGNAINGLKMIETIKSNGNEADFFAKVTGYRSKILVTNQEMALMSQTVNMVPALLAGLNGALIYTIGGYSIMSGLMTAGVFMAFQSLMRNFTMPFNRLIVLGQSLQNTEMQMSRLNDVMKYPVDKLHFPDEEQEFSKNYLSGKLELQNISFGYSALEKPLLQDISFTINPRRWVAVVGASGSGKSTLGKIVMGIYEQWTGNILLDDVDRRKINRKVIVNSLSSVDQNTFQITGSVRDNISLFDKSISRDDVIRAAKDACIHDDIIRMNGGYDATVDESGRNFSGGQQQRLEIARALAVNPSILILDEATSALDPLTEMQIMDNIRHRGCSCMIIAHRLSTIRDCDEIIVLERGRIVERGTHTELIQNGGPYYNLVMDQQRMEKLPESLGVGK